jgi:hypothetical protein
MRTPGCGCIGHPAFPAPSLEKGDEISGKARAYHVARMRARVDAVGQSRTRARSTTNCEARTGEVDLTCGGYDLGRRVPPSSLCAQRICFHRSQTCLPKTNVTAGIGPRVTKRRGYLFANLFIAATLYDLSALLTGEKSG